MIKTGITQDYSDCGITQGYSDCGITPGYSFCAITLGYSDCAITLVYSDCGLTQDLYYYEDSSIQEKVNNTVSNNYNLWIKLALLVSFHLHTASFVRQFVRC